MKTISTSCSWSIPLLLGLTLLANQASAHRLGEGYIILDVGEDTLSGRIELNLDDVDDALELDRDGDGVIDPAELDASLSRLREYVEPRIKIGTDATWWQITYSGHELANYPLGNYVVLPFEAQPAGAVPDKIRIEYELLFDHDDNQKGLLVIEKNSRIGFENNSEIVSTLFNQDRSLQTVDLTEFPQQNLLGHFIKEGIWHIWIGLDHILFLIALLLPSVRNREEPWWKPVEKFQSAFWQVLKVVTLFTIAHSVTLALASMQIVQLPGYLVETIIAGSIVVAAIDNIYPVFKGNIGWVVFVFGLFHGLGFANVLAPLTLSQVSIATTLLGFNIGVELGQLAIICVAFPILFAIRRNSWYPSVIQRGLSSLLVILGVCWMIERMFDMTIVGF